MTRIMRKLKNLKKKIAERYKDKPEENEPAVKKKDPEKDR
jgi:hypothetical protein